MAAYLVESCCACVLCTVQNETDSFILHSFKFSNSLKIKIICVH